MEYQISENVKNKLAALTADTKIQKALQVMEDEQDLTIEKQIELTLIPAPTYHEEKKAKRLLEMFKEEGLEDCHIDEYGNAVGIRRGTGGGKTVLCEAHMDTVFDMDTKLEIKREDGFIRCPGITDNTRGCASLIATIRGLNAAGVKTKGDIQFVGTVQEEGMGALKGMQYYVQHHPELQASISVDEDRFQYIIFEATGIQTYEVTFHGVGGHAFAAFGDVANPIHAAGRAIAKIAEIQVPTEPKTTFAVTNLEAGNISAVHAIVSDCTIRLNFRSDEQDELEKLRAKIENAIKEACEEETARWGKDTITYDIKRLVDVNVGHQDSHAPIVEAAVAVAKYLGCEEPVLEHGGSTNCSRALEGKLPAVCLGEGPGYDCKCHTLAEQFQPEGAYKGSQAAMLMAVLCAGTEAADSIIE